MGFDAAVQELVSPKTKAAGLLLAADVSPKTEKEIRFAAEKCGKSLEETQKILMELYGALIKRIADKGEA